VQGVAIAHSWEGMSPEEISHKYPALSLAEIHSTLAYYFDHHDEIEVEIKGKGMRLRYSRETIQILRANHVVWFGG